MDTVTWMLVLLKAGSVGSRVTVVGHLTWMLGKKSSGLPAGCGDAHL